MENKQEHKKGSGGKRPGAGRPKSAETVTISLRVNKKILKAVRAKYGRGLNKMFNQWLESLLK